MIVPAFENIPLWHERDLTNSANERFIFSTSFVILDEMLKRSIEVLEGLIVYPENMKKNLEITGGLILSEKVVNKLVEKGVNRQDAHELVRTCSMLALSKKLSFKEVLKGNKSISEKLSIGEIEESLDYNNYLGVTKNLIDKAVKRTEEEMKK